MMGAKNILAVTCSAISLLVYTSGTMAQAMSLEDALTIAYRNNPELKAERASLKATDENFAIARSGFLPDVSISYNRNHEWEDFGNGEVSSNPETKSLNLNQSLFSGGQTINQINQAKYQILSGRERLRATEQQVLVNAIVAYMNVVRTKRVHELSISNQNVLEEQLEATNDRFELGETTRTDVAQSESRLARAESDRINALGDFTSAQSEFRRVFRVAPDVESMDIPELLPAIPETIGIAEQEALKNSPILKLAEYDMEAADSAVNRNLGLLLPSVTLNGSISETDDSNPAFGIDKTESKIIGVSVRVPLYQSGEEYARIRQSKDTLRRAEHVLEDAEDRTRNLLTQSWEDVQTTRANIKATQAAMEAAKLALEGVREEQEVGSRTTLDVLDAEQELFITKVNHITAQRNFVVATYNLLAAMGKLSPSELGLDVPDYNPKEHFENIKYKLIGF